MFQSHIVLTQTYIDREKLMKLIAYNFEKLGGLSKSLKELNNSKILDSVSDEELENSWQKSLGNKQVIHENYGKKGDFRKNLLRLYEVYSKPTLLFLGDLNDYSVKLQEGMLSLLEEPPENLIILLFAHNKTQVLPTISSRSRFFMLKKDLVMKILDLNLLEKTKKNLPIVNSFARDIIEFSSSGKQKSLNVPDLKKVEREEIDFWLWQVAAYLEQFYRQDPNRFIAKALDKVIQSQKFNQENVQKKLAFGWLTAV